MTHWEKIQYYYSEMPKRGRSPVWATPSQRVPAVYRLFGRLGIEVRPPIFASFGALAFVIGGCFAVMYGVANWLIFGRGHYSSVAQMIFVFVFAGALFGAITARQIRRLSKRLKLPDWDHYPDGR